MAARRSGIVEADAGRPHADRAHELPLAQRGEMHLHGHADEGHQGGGRQRGGPARDSRIVGEGEVDPASRRLDGQVARVGVEALELADEGGLDGAGVRPDGAKQERDDHQTRRSGEQQHQAANRETDNAAHPAHPSTRRVPDPFEAGKIEAALDSPENTAASAPVPPDLLGQNDPAVALSRTHTSVSLRARLALFVAVVVGTVVGLGSFLLIQLFEGLAASEIRTEAQYTAQAVADELELRTEAPKADTLRSELGPYADLPMVRDVTVVALGPDPWSVTTAAALRPDRENLALRAAQARSLVWGERSPQVTLAAVPIVRDGRVFGGVAVAVALDVSGQIRRSGRQLAFWFAVVSIILLTLLVDALVRRLVHRPITSMLGTMQRAGAGDIAARSAIARDDELGAVARGLNDMLARLERVHLTQSQRIAEATQALDARNQEIVTSYQRMFALREALARAQQTAAAGKTAANLAHQIGTPLNLISGYVQVMLEETDPTSGRRTVCARSRIRFRS